MEISLITSKIHFIRGQKVMLDFDLAELYQVETKNLNLSVKRNITRFPSDFMFQLAAEEWNALRFHFATSKRGGRRYMPYAFTEQGVAMLSGLLNSEAAINVNIAIMRAFVLMRQYLLNPTDNAALHMEMQKLKKYIEEVFTDYNDMHEDTRLQLELINKTLAALQAGHTASNKPRRRIGFTNEIIE